jgi:hypothetical protein
MAKFCYNCGNSLQSEWNVCPYCGCTAYDKSYQPIEDANGTCVEELVPIKKEPSRKKRLTKAQKKAIMIGLTVLTAAILIPVISVAIYKYSFPTKEVEFYVNNGLSLASYTVTTKRSKLEFYHSQPHPSHSHWDANYTASIVESYCTPDETKIIEIAEGIRSKCLDQNDSEEVINAVLSFSQAIGYEYDTIDLAQYPMETIYNQGDCEDLSVLFGSLVEALGYDAIIAIINVYDETEGIWIGHACVGVYLNYTPTEHPFYPPSYSFSVSENSNEYWICETTNQGWMIGALPVSNPSYFILLGYAFID